MNQPSAPTLPTVEEAAAYYTRKRASMVEALRSGKLAVPEGAVTKEVTSPSGVFRLEITPLHWIGQNYIGSTQVDVFKGDRQIFRIVRNYSSFSYVFIEGHPNGHDYLICGEDYQGVTVLELDTWEKRNHFPQVGALGWGWCMAEFIPSPDKVLLAVSGCHWAAPFEVRIFDLSDPMDLPWGQVGGLDAPEIQGWGEDGACLTAGEVDLLHLATGRYESDIPEEESEAIWKQTPDNEDEDGKIWQTTIKVTEFWTRTSPQEWTAANQARLEKYKQDGTSWIELPVFEEMVRRQVDKYGGLKG